MNNVFVITITVAVLALRPPVFAEGGTSVPVPRDRCDSTDIDDGVRLLYKDAPVEQVKQDLKPTSTFSEGAEIVCAQRGNLDYPLKVNAYQVEYGNRDGFGYRIYYSDSSGSVTVAGKEKDFLTASLWSVNCDVDSMDDSRSCYLSQGSLFIWFTGNNQWRVYIGASNSPGSEIALRVGDGKALRATEPAFSPAVSREIVQTLTSNQDATVRIRFQTWPTEIHEEEFKAQGLGVALQLVEWAYRSIRP